VSLKKESLNLLLAEDNPDDVFFFRNAFKKAEVSGMLHAVCDGVEAVAYLKGEAAYHDRASYPFPDVLLLDLNMPRMDGFEVLEWVRTDAKCSRLIVHVLSYSARDADVARAYELHANSYIIKPTRVDELAAFMRALREWQRFVVLATQGDCAPLELAGEKVY